jgi:hypothetical protein
MSTRKRSAYAAPAWAAEQRVGSVGAKAVLLVLANYADENFSCYPGQQTIAYETEQHVNTVARQLKRLAELNLIRREKRYGKDGTRTSDRYFLQLDLVVDVHETPDGTGESLPTIEVGSELPTDSVGRQADAVQPPNDYPPSAPATNHHDASDYPPPGGGGTPSSRTPSSRTPSVCTDPPTASQHKPPARSAATDADDEPVLLSSDDLADGQRPALRAVDDDAEFAEFWSVYPRHVAKGAARRAWKTARKRATADDIIAGARRYGADTTRPPQYTKHPATWLNSECWADEAEPQAGIQQRPGRAAPWRDQTVTAEEHARLAAQFDGVSVNGTRIR